MGKARLIAIAGLATVVLVFPVVLGTIRVADTNELPFFDFRVDTVGVLEGLARDGNIDISVAVDAARSEEASCRERV